MIDAVRNATPEEKKELVKSMLDTMSAEEIADAIPALKQNAVYRLLWADYVREDVVSWAEDNDRTLSEGDVETVVERLVFNCKYDCNLDYWSNIESVVNSL